MNSKVGMKDMQKILIRQTVIFVIIFLFLGTSIVPGVNIPSRDFRAILKHTIGNTTTVLKPLSGSPPSIEWWRQFGKYGHSDLGQSVEQTTDGGYILTGYTESYGAGDKDIWLIRTDKLGGIQWDKTFGGSSEDWGYSVEQTKDNGYILTGYTNSFGSGGSDVWLIKTDSSGNEEWNETFGGQGTDIGYCVQQTTDDGYIIIGSTTSYGAGSADVWLIKTNGTGVEQWNKTFGGTKDDEGYSGQQTEDGGFVVVGQTQSYGAGGLDVWILKTDANGHELWNKTYGLRRDDFGESIQQTADKGFIIAGTTYSYGYAGDVWLIKTDSSGNQEWNKSYGGSGEEYGHSVRQTTDGGYIVTGETMSYGQGDDNLWLIKTYSNGHKRWNTTFNGPLWEIGYCVRQTSDAGYIVTGMTSGNDVFFGNVFLAKYKADPAPTYTRVFMVGIISNLNVYKDIISFNSVKVTGLQFKPFKFLKYNATESISIGPQYTGILGKHLVIGFFKLVI
jgi:hypothetical protein